MVLAADGPISEPLNYFKESIAASAVFQTWCGVATAALAKAFIFQGKTAEASITDPMVNLYTAEEFGRESNEKVWMYNEPTLIADFLTTIPAEYTTDDDVITYVRNQVGNVMENIEAIFEAAGYLNVTGWGIAEPAYVVKTDTDQGQMFGRHGGMGISVIYGGI